MPRKRYFAHLLLVLAALLCLGTGRAYADPLLFDNGPGNFLSFRGAGSSPLARITVSAPVTITQIGVRNDLNTSGNIKFLIFDDATGAMLFESAPQFFADDGLTYKVSDVFAPFVLLPGAAYDIGGIADVGGGWSTWNMERSFTQNGITSCDPNQNVVNFTNPVLAGRGTADIVIQLYGTTAVPEPAALLLFGTGLIGIGTAVRKRMKREE